MALEGPHAYEIREELESIVGSGFGQDNPRGFTRCGDCDFEYRLGKATTGGSSAATSQNVPDSLVLIAWKAAFQRD